MARRGHKCRCCQPPIDDPCLASCRPAGESGALSAINLTLSGSDYTLEFDATVVRSASVSGVGTFTRNYKFRYLFPGSLYAGTFSLTPRLSDPTIYEYLFDECGEGCQGYIRFLTGLEINNCRLQAFLPGVTEPDSWPPDDGNDDAASCGVSLPVATFQPSLTLSSCGPTDTTLVDGSKIALTGTPEGAIVLTGNKTLRSAIDENFAYVSPCVLGTGNGSSFHVVVGQTGSILVSDTITAANVSESGDPLVKITNIETAYA